MELVVEVEEPKQRLILLEIVRTNQQIPLQAPNLIHLRPQNRPIHSQVRRLTLSLEEAGALMTYSANQNQPPIPIPLLVLDQDRPHHRSPETLEAGMMTQYSLQILVQPQNHQCKTTHSDPHPLRKTQALEVSSPMSILCR